MEVCMRMALIFVSFCLYIRGRNGDICDWSLRCNRIRCQGSWSSSGRDLRAGVRVICASRWLGRVAVKREPLAVARPAQHHTAINVTPVANCWIVENQLHFFIFK